ncbi:MAG TPA: FHA domain-containing protein, partial [Ktedonobacteraceae bacterium]|nr:FHA domain-containing protein [Ktedonobacteraceae bacterium]
MLDEQNRYSAERAGDRSILRSAYVPLPVGDQQWQMRPNPVVPQNQPVTPAHSPVPLQVVPVVPVTAASLQNGGNGANQAPQRARVRIEVDGKMVGAYQLDRPVLAIGRLGGNDVQVPSQSVSRMHAKLRWENGSWLIEDANSLNGIVYQGNRVDRHVLANGDQIFLAPKVILHYEAM